MGHLPTTLIWSLAMVTVTAAALLDPNHPLHKAFVAACKQKRVEPSKRQARQFLSQYPQYKTIKMG